MSSIKRLDDLLIFGLNKNRQLLLKSLASCRLGRLGVFKDHLLNILELLEYVLLAVLMFT